MPSAWRSTKRFSQKINEVDPNKLADVVHTDVAESTDVSCQFLGKTFYQNDKICWKDTEWVCTPQGWSQTGKTC